ncbi:MAG: hypothetical protein GC129_03545 [Proteobacteria bacterium]|nr:hypothetical protein [Pseudomonadota bacterium]
MLWKPENARERIVVSLDEVESLPRLVGVTNALRRVGVGSVKVRWSTLLRFKDELKKKHNVLDNFRVFGDFKFNETPNSMLLDLQEAMSLVNLQWVTCHGTASWKMLHALRDFVAEHQATGLTAVGVTVTTDTGEAECVQRWGNSVRHEVGRRAYTLHHHAKANAFVCAGTAEEINILRTMSPYAFLFCPGIRLVGRKLANDDQERVVSPEEGIANGADMLIVGRPVVLDNDPAAVVLAIAERIAAVTPVA